MHREGRFELKFLISRQQKERIRSLCQEILRPDHHGREGVYRVTSQYYDTPDYRAYWEKLDGVSMRRKFRLRYYDNLEAARAFFFEIKRRDDRIIAKHRVRVHPDAARRYLYEGESPGSLCENLIEPREKELLTAEEITLESYRSQLRPANVVTYIREAWVGILESRLRLTFDQLCQSCPPGCYHWDQARALHPSGQMIMEVKFDQQLPRWLRDRLTEVEALPIRFSKYQTGLDALTVSGRP